MGKLDEPAFAAIIASCKKCDAKAFEVASYIDRQVTVMLGERNDDGRWIHDGEKFIDGVYRVKCIRCSDVAFTTEDCPRCHREGGLVDARPTVAARGPEALPRVQRHRAQRDRLRTVDGADRRRTPSFTHTDRALWRCRVPCRACDV